MTRIHAIRRALLVSAVGALVACESDTTIVTPTPADAIFQSYVALGNSITAGFQSGGLNDSTQQRSYAVLIARQMGTRFAYPSFNAPGCPPPVNNFLTQSRVNITGLPTPTSSTCYLRQSATATLNNVAVPGITSLEPTAPTGNAVSGPLEQLILGGETMVQKALDNKPTFATVWIGNNDVLSPAVSGIPGGSVAGAGPGTGGPATTVAAFQANYAKMINALVAGAPGIKGVLIAVVHVTNLPIMFQAGVIAQSAAAKAAASQVAGRPVDLDPLTCAGANAGALVAFPAVAAIAARPAAQPGTIYCQKVLGGGTGDPGDNGILDITEQATVATLINGYNAYIRAKADSIGFAYYDPNVVLTTFKGNGSIPPFPNLAAPTTVPFGQYFSLDGVHPSAAAHVVIANELITTINAKYGTRLAAVQ